MEALHLPDNIKVHFAGIEAQHHYSAIYHCGVRYGLYTCFPYVERKLFDKGNAPIIPMKWMTDPYKQVPENICTHLRHTIQDSGLFTLMFGSRKGKKDEQMINKWYDGLVEYTLNHAQPVTCVEVDCQKVLGVDKAWEFRERMKHDLPNNRIINVFHIEDGKKGLDRLIEFSDYIAISVPELRYAGKKAYVPTIARYIKEKKPNIDIHLLGCTEKALLHECRFCTSADSTSYLSGNKFGFIEGRHVKNIKTEKVIELIGEEAYNTLRDEVSDGYINGLCLMIEKLKREYQEAAGNQDYYLKI